MKPIEVESIEEIEDILAKEHQNFINLILERFNNEDYSLYNGIFENGIVMKANKEKIEHWYRIDDWLYSDSFIDCKECVLRCIGIAWWGTTEHIIQIGGLTKWDIITKIKEDYRNLGRIELSPEEIEDGINQQAIKDSQSDMTEDDD